MDIERIYSKEEIRKILAKASEIQTKNELYGEDIGLDEEELYELAKEIGVSRDALKEALQSYSDPTLDEDFNWLTPTTRLQHVEHLKVELTPVSWEKIVQEIRNETGGIGKSSYIGSTYEWEQRRKELGYKHFSFSPTENGTRVQMVSSWSGVKWLSYMVAFMIPFTLVTIRLDDLGFGAAVALLIAIGAGSLGLLPARLYLKTYFERQKKQLKNLVSRIDEKVRGRSVDSIVIDENVAGLESDSEKQKKRSRP